MQAEAEIKTGGLSPTYERMMAAAAVAGMTAASAAVAYWDPSKENFFPVCPLYQMTGLACPGCGLTRGFHALFHGDILTALDFNALVPVWVVILGYVWIALLLLAITGRGLPMWATNPKFLWGFMIVLVAFGVLRNIPAYPLTILYP